MINNMFTVHLQTCLVVYPYGKQLGQGIISHKMQGQKKVSAQLYLAQSFCHSSWINVQIHQLNGKAWFAVHSSFLSLFIVTRHLKRWGFQMQLPTQQQQFPSELTLVKLILRLFGCSVKPPCSVTPTFPVKVRINQTKKFSSIYCSKIIFYIIQPQDMQIL